MGGVQGDPGARPVDPALRAELPPQVVATPSDMPDAFDPQAPFWAPDWMETLALLGWRWIIIVGVAGIVVALGWFFWHHEWLALGYSFALGKLAIVLGTVVFSLVIWIRKNATRMRREPFCIHCGYSLVGLADGELCPECGRRFRLVVTEEYRRDPQWFVQRYRARGRAPQTGATLVAGPQRNAHNDGTR